MSRRNKKKRSPVMIGVGFVVAVVLSLMLNSIVKLKQTEARYLEKEAYLQQQYEEESERAKEIEKLSEYVHTTQYIEEIAKSKLGLAYENEIIFKESGD